MGHENNNMSEILPEPVSMEYALYEEAMRFRENIDSLDVASAEEADERVKVLLKELNSKCGYLGIGLEVTSDHHNIDLSHAEVPGVRLESAIGPMRGTLIGFGMFPYHNPDTGECQPSLATIMDAAIEDDLLEVDFPIVIITPITGAEINLITSDDSLL